MRDAFSSYHPAVNALWFALAQLVFTLPVVWINREFFRNGWVTLTNKAPGMDTLVSLGSGASCQEAQRHGKEKVSFHV